MAADHTDTGSIRKVIEDHNCDTCHQVFNSKKRLKKHRKKKHTTGRKYTCEICEKTFRKSKTLRIHIRQDYENQSCRSEEKDVQDENKDGEHKVGVNENK